MKEPIPSVNLEVSDMPSVKDLTPEELKQVPFDRRRLTCCVQDCSRYTIVKDYGTSPEFYAKRAWYNLQESIYLCHVHFRAYKANNRSVEGLQLKNGPSLNHIK